MYLKCDSHEDLTGPPAIGADAGDVVLELGREVRALIVIERNVRAGTLPVPCVANVDVAGRGSLLRR